jgi:hypothetical protein
LDDSLFHQLQRHAASGDEVLLRPEHLRAVADELTAGRALRAREQQLIAALKTVEYGVTGITSTAPACPACRSACGMGHDATCPVGAALRATAIKSGGHSSDARAISIET